MQNLNFSLSPRNLLQVSFAIASKSLYLATYPFRSLTRDTVAARKRNYARIKRLAWWLDAQYRILGYRIGLDPLLQSIPVIGNIISTILSIWIIFTAWRFGINRVGLIRMCLNMLLDFAFGVLPFVGILADIAWKSNLRNLKILEEHLSTTDLLPQDAADEGWIGRLIRSVTGR